MFRSKKAAVGQVTILDDDESDAPTQASQLRDELELNNPHFAKPNPDEMDKMNSEQLQQLIQESAQAGKQSTTQALQTVLEARDIGVSTAEKMQQQTTQLEKMTDDIEVVHDYLDQSERTIEKMTKNRIVRMFQVRKPKGKGLDQQKASRKEQEAREELRAKGLESVDVRGMQKKSGVVSMKEIQQEELLSEKSDVGSVNEKRRRLFGKKAQPEPASVETKNIQEDYSHYSDDVANVLKKQDEDLDQISEVLGDMKVLANAMNNELEYQSEKIEEVQGFTAETSRRTKANARKVAKIK